METGDPSMNNSQLSRIVLQGFRSIRACDLELKELNVLIGPNGAGKSNFIEFFQLIRNILESKLQPYVSKQGGPDALLHFGRKTTEGISADLYFGENDENGYKFTLKPTQDNMMMFEKESYFWWSRSLRRQDKLTASSHFETIVESQKIYDDYVVPPMRSWRIYHFHDTSKTALVKRRHGINDNLYLSPDARNLAAFLYLLKDYYLPYYRRIVKVIQLAAPFFGDFLLRPQPDNREQIELEWMHKGEDVPFKAHLLSDGTLRFICLATILLQPEGFQPQTILIDEPELGLHPFAINLLAALLRSASKERQIVVSTQSVSLLNQFTAEDIIVANRHEDCTYLQRLDPGALESWLAEYSLGELWDKNLLGGRP